MYLFYQTKILSPKSKAASFPTSESHNLNTLNSSFVSILKTILSYLGLIDKQTLLAAYTVIVILQKPATIS